MTPHQLDHSLDDLIHLDPAADVQPQRDLGTTLEQIYATPSTLRSTPRRPRRWPLAAAGLAAASAAALIAAPSLTSPHDAYADWTHTPQAVDAVRDHATAEECRTAIQAGPRHLPATPILTDRRGDWALALLTTAKGPFTCLLLGQATPEARAGAVVGDLGLPATVPASGIVLSQGGRYADDNGPIVRAIVGKVAPDITAVTLHTAAQGDVRATLLDGWVLAWWPGESWHPPAPDENDPVDRGYDTVRITRKDGTTTTLPASTVVTPRT